MQQDDLYVAYELNYRLHYIADMLHSIHPTELTEALRVLLDRESTIARLAKDHLDYVSKCLQEK
jgi:hypothetical protein